jgi:hypothetical protein
MSNVVEPSRVGDLSGLEAALEVVDTQKQCLLVLWDLAVSVALLVDPVASEVVSVVVSTEEEAGADSEEASKTVGAMAVEEEVLDIKAVEAFLLEAGMEEEIVVGTVDQMDSEHPLPMLQLVPVVLEVGASAAAGTAEEVTVALVPQIATVLACQRQLVGMTHVEVAAHMMTDPVDIVAVAIEVTETAMGHLVQEVVAIWSR